MAEFAETFEVMQKENYSGKETEFAICAEHRAENGTDADGLQIRIQRAELRADVCAVIRAEPFADICAVVGVEPRAVIRAVVRADGYAEKGNNAKTVCRNGLQKPCRLWHRESGQKKMAQMQNLLQKPEGQMIKAV